MACREDASRGGGEPPQKNSVPMGDHFFLRKYRMDNWSFKFSSVDVNIR